MNAFDPEKERRERKLSLGDFLKMYNENLPEEFPHATRSALLEFRSTFPGLFKRGTDSWSLDHHRKRFMDWLPQHLRALSLATTT